MSRTTPLLVAVALIGALAGFLAGGGQLQLGSQAPAAGFAATEREALSGGTARLADFRGRRTLVNVWATWCTPCIAEMPLLQALHEREPRLAVVGLAADDPEAVRAFVAKHGITYPILFDVPGPEGLAAMLGNDRGALPYTVLLSETGGIVRTHYGAFDEAALARFVQ